MEMDCSVEGSGYKGGHESSNNGEIKWKHDGKEKQEGKGVRGNNDKELPIDLRPRIRWTNRLHEIFVDAVQLLGGSQYATPKNIVREMGVKGLTVGHVKSHLQKYRRQQKQASTKGHGAPLIHATGYGSSSNQIEVGTFGPVIPMQTATDLGGQFVEPVITPCIRTQNWNSTMMPTPTHQGDNSSNPTIPQNEMQSLPLHEEIQMHLLTPPAAEEQRYKSLVKVEGSTNMMAPAHGSSSDPRLQTPEEDSTASDESFLDLDDWPC